jgi:hypothetical protein
MCYSGADNDFVNEFYDLILSSTSALSEPTGTYYIELSPNDGGRTRQHYGS